MPRDCTVAQNPSSGRSRDLERRAAQSSSGRIDALCQRALERIPGRKYIQIYFINSVDSSKRKIWKRLYRVWWNFMWFSGSRDGAYSQLDSVAYYFIYVCICRWTPAACLIELFANILQQTCDVNNAVIYIPTTTPHFLLQNRCLKVAENACECNKQCALWPNRHFQKQKMDIPWSKPPQP